MPTFDFFNVVRRLISASLSLVANPVAALLAFSAVVGTVGAAFVAFFSDLGIPELGTLDVSTLFSNFDSDWLAFILYTMDVGSFVELFDFCISTINGLISFVLLFFPTFFVGLWAYRVYLTLRNQIKDTAG